MTKTLLGVLTLSMFVVPAALAQDEGEPSRRHHTIQDHNRFHTNRSVPMLNLPNEEDAFFFVVFGDRTGGPAEGIKVLEQAVVDTNLLEPDLVMTVGDLINGYNTHEPWMAQMREYTGVMDQLYCPWFPVAGNHDVYWRGEGKPEGEHESNYETHFGPLWYAFEHKNSMFIVLYSDEGNPETGEKSISKASSQVMSEAQFAWLQSMLREGADADHVFVFLHHPRWLGGNYGDDWDKVHEVLVEAGNVSGVFAGHIHRARFDPRDGIEYFTLATVGGGQSNKVPEAGYLHHFDIVTVRKDQIAVASIPVGGVQDVRAITGEVSTEAGRLADVRPGVETPLHVTSEGVADGRVTVSVTNPTSRPVELTMSLESADSRWTATPDHNHGALRAGESREFEFGVERMEGLDRAFRTVDVVMNMDYLAERARISIPEVRSALPLAVDLSAPVRPTAELVGDFDGASDHVRVDSASIPLPDGPITVECWMKGRSFGRRVGLLAKTESSEYGIFVNRGEPHFSVFLGDRYVTANPREQLLEVGRWHHVAGVYDGEQVRLYLDGKLVASTEGTGRRRTNNLPFYVGADVRGNGEPMSHFDGLIDGVRLSAGAVYTGESFTPERRLGATDETYLLLNMDGVVGPWLFDESGRGAHPVVNDTLELVEVE